MDANSQIGIWDSYQQQANPLVVKDGNEWVELTVADLVRLITDALGRPQR